MVQLVCTAAQGQHTGFHTDGLDLRTVELVTGPRQLGPVNVLAHVHLSAVDLQDLCARLLVGYRELDLTVQTSRTQQGGIQNIDTVGCCNNLQIECSEKNKKNLLS